MIARRFSARALWGLASWALPLVVVFLVTPQLLHALGAARFGVLMLIFLTPLIAAQLDFGIVSTGVRQLAAALAHGKVDARQTLATLGAALTLIGLVLGAMVWLAAPAISSALGFDSVLGSTVAVDLVRACALWIALTMATLLPGLMARSAQALVLITYVQTLSAILLWLGALVIVRADRPLLHVVALGAGLSVGFAAATAFALRRQIDWSGPIRLDFRSLLNERSFSAGMFGSQLAGMLVYQGDRLLISSFGSPAIAGAYALCANLANKLLAAVVAVTSFAFPHASGLHATGAIDALTALLHALDRAVAVLIIPLLFPALWLADTFLTLWLGAYGTAELVFAFRVLLIAFTVSAFAVPVGHVLAASGNSMLAARFSWLTAVVVTLGIVTLVPRYGLLGAVAAILAGMSTSLIFNPVARRTLSLQKPHGRLRFWTGVWLGLATQGAFLFFFARFAIDWLTLLCVGTGAWAIFFLARATLRTLSPEEHRLLNRLSERSAS